MIKHNPSLTCQKHFKCGNTFNLKFEKEYIQNKITKYFKLLYSEQILKNTSVWAQSKTRNTYVKQVHKILLYPTFKIKEKYN